MFGGLFTFHLSHTPRREKLGVFYLEIAAGVKQPRSSSLFGIVEQYLIVSVSNYVTNCMCVIRNVIMIAMTFKYLIAVIKCILSVTSFQLHF